LHFLCQLHRVTHRVTQQIKILWNSVFPPCNTVELLNRVTLPKDQQLICVHLWICTPPRLQRGVNCQSFVTINRPCHLFYKWLFGNHRIFKNQNRNRMRSYKLKTKNPSLQTRGSLINSGKILDTTLIAEQFQQPFPFCQQPSQHTVSALFCQNYR